MAMKLTRFFNDMAGLEKTLRLIQAVAQIAAVFTVGSTAVRLTTAKLQLALTRRFFRFFSFVGAFERVFTLLIHGGLSSTAGTIDMAKWTAFGFYFILEDTTILHALGVWQVPWEERMMRLHALYTASQEGPAEPNREKEKTEGKLDEKEGEQTQEAPAPKVNTSAVWQQVVGESCDILLPLELLNWMPTGDLVIGVTMVVSTLLSIRSVWARV
ncbi:hypothetical protein N7468_008434 [Penicillium chermesinum]|uniref:Peroxin 11B n=1 Tax=Penicillium chermesinum TaxID=63820 RepID=A0A9W9TIA9_9EURO|nr:uncharacterized protein N7468_008434 [Penicillium chermesinum]KAJ5223892.1 hypothetical protein N7468_008434 [Penicillium chermesinum]